MRATSASGTRRKASYSASAASQRMRTPRLLGSGIGSGVGRGVGRSSAPEKVGPARNFEPVIATSNPASR